MKTRIRKVLVRIGMAEPPPYGCREVMKDVNLYFKLSAFNPPEDRDVREVKERFSAHLPGIGSGDGDDDCSICSPFYRHVQRKMAGETTQQLGN
ncbi:MAG: hypothetical protein AAB487_02210 [Patescibacteria group bacterium]